MKFAALAVSMFIAFPCLAADENKPTKPAPPEVMKDAVDPYTPGKERTRFLTAAGVDSELTETEFDAATDADASFVRQYDHWSSLKSFDKNKDKNIDWFEADSYRRALRKAVLTKYDENKDNKLTGDERAAANKDLARGNIPKIIATSGGSAGPGPAPGVGEENPRPDRGERFRGRRGRFIERFDKDGDGELSQEEREAMAVTMIKEGRERQVRKWDEDGDGLLNEAEREKVMQDRGDQWWLKIDDLGMKHFDADNDGKLSDQESQDIVAFGKQLQDMGKKWELEFLDSNGDGEITAEERQAMRGRMQMVGISMLPKAMTWFDQNGDGRVDQDEREDAMFTVEKAARRNIKMWTDKFDGNGDGRLDPAERKKLVGGIDKDIAQRYARHDKDGDGQLSNTEIASWLEEAAEEWGVKPAQDKS